jgi:release factor glutamine methyltransferase
MPGTTKTDPSCGNWLATAAARLNRLDEQPQLTAQVLLAHALATSRTALLAHPETILLPSQQKTAGELLDGILSGEPLPYVLGTWEFYGLSFIISPFVLIPRPETELLVETAINWLKAHPNRRQAADIGTGSGCIAVSLAASIPGLQVVATDISQHALDVARQNIAKHNLADRISTLLADLLPASTSRFDLVCANLPYIPSGKLTGLKVSSHEPALALDGGPDGLALIRRLLALLPTHLAPAGLALLEIEETTAGLALQAAKTCFASRNCRVVPDLAGHSRLLVIDLS